ncbi:hypothetical protein EB796_014556 [Bugula neritina]|uniref:Integrase catalytic domain-containing protein n=1 Tax=Bugula neritina TaxID=10212 RepID=A0A7J7JNG0_BUGNE|nr:hypothetical protein EB796_014556 [Bugula neritina]
MARTNIYGPGMRADRRRYIDGCSKCIIHRKMKTLSMNPSKLPDPPWHTLELDLFEYKSKDYLLMIDYYSRWIEVIEIEKKTVETVVKEMNKVFVRIHIPDEDSPAPQDEFCERNKDLTDRQKNVKGLLLCPR